MLISPAGLNRALRVISPYPPGKPNNPWMPPTNSAGLPQNAKTWLRTSAATMRSPLGTTWRSDGVNAPKPTKSAEQRCLMLSDDGSRGSASYGARLRPEGRPASLWISLRRGWTRGRRNEAPSPTFRAAEAEEDAAVPDTASTATTKNNVLLLVIALPASLGSERCRNTVEAHHMGE